VCLVLFLLLHVAQGTRAGESPVPTAALQGTGRGRGEALRGLEAPVATPRHRRL
uniref:Uncharacterized protein n=1 Tax=Taeniopygia guttata TaxID=59729 RepID=A0A674GSN3_TAEGU